MASSRFQKGHKSVGGRPKGVPNKVTRDIKEAFRLLLENNTENFERWIAEIAQGEKTQKVVKDANGKDVVIDIWLREPNPAKALELLGSLAEFNIPKLQRSELVGDKSQPLIIQSAPGDEAI